MSSIHKYYLFADFIPGIHGMDNLVGIYSNLEQAQMAFVDDKERTDNSAHVAIIDHFGVKIVARYRRLEHETGRWCNANIQHGSKVRLFSMPIGMHYDDPKHVGLPTGTVVDMVSPEDHPLWVQYTIRLDHLMRRNYDHEPERLLSLAEEAMECIDE